MLSIGAEIKCDFAKGFFAGTDGQKSLMQARFAVSVEQASREVRAVLTDKQVPTSRVLQQGGNPGLVDYHIDGVEPASDLIGKRPRMCRVANP